MHTLAGCAGVSFKEVALYDKYEEPPAREKITPIIFDDAAGTMWNSLEDCGAFEVTTEAAYSGKSAIKISWDKSKGCEWMGFGNSFNNWAAADLSKERFKLALSFYVRTQEKTSKAVPIVANLEDFAGGGSYYFIDTKKYLEGLQVDTSWKRIVVPLWHFPVNADEVDIYSIKQMKFQLEGAGSFFLDEIKLIDYSDSAYQAMRDRVEAMKPKGEPEQVVYREGNLDFDAWGNVYSPCSELAEKVDDSGNKMVYWSFDAKDCSWAKWGINWNDWYQINFRGILDDSKLTFRYKKSKGAGFEITLQSFTYDDAKVFEVKPGGSDQWLEAEIPLKDLNLIGKKFDLDQVKQLLFEGTGAGEVYIDDIQITRE